MTGVNENFAYSVSYDIFNEIIRFAALSINHKNRNQY